MHDRAELSIDPPVSIVPCSKQFALFTFRRGAGEPVIYCHNQIRQVDRAVFIDVGAVAETVGRIDKLAVGVTVQQTGYVWVEPDLIANLGGGVVGGGGGGGGGQKT